MHYLDKDECGERKVIERVAKKSWSVGTKVEHDVRKRDKRVQTEKQSD